jgi:hexulose-6-phosphate isomerase
MTGIGIMQGRLLPPREGRLQAFPGPRWREEFALARAAGLQALEWIYDEDDGENPLDTERGIREIVRHVEATGVRVGSVCADYYMTHNLVAPCGRPRERTVEHLRSLLRQAALVGAAHVVLPLVDSGALRTESERKGLADAVVDVLADVHATGTQVHLETDWTAGVLVQFLSELGDRSIRATYDIGNAAALGRPPEEILEIGGWLGSVHVKDRRRDGASVPLGTGDADLPTCLRYCQDVGFAGIFVLQAAREARVPETRVARSQRRLVEHLLTREAAAAHDALRT